MNQQRIWVGMDVAAASVQVCCVSGEGEPLGVDFEIPQGREGYAQLTARLRALGREQGDFHVVMEACGGYHRRLAQFLYEQGWQVRVVNAFQVKRFGEVYLERDKSDAIDALTLARYGAMLHPEAWKPIPSKYEALGQRLVQREALQKLRTQTLNRQKALRLCPIEVGAVAERWQVLENLLKCQIRSLEREIAGVVKGDPEWHATARRITSIPGVGVTTAAWLIWLTQDFSTCRNAKELCAFVGVVPHVRQSGTSLRSHTPVGLVGQDEIRRHLYRVTVSCLRYNARIRAFYERVKARRGRHKIACVAATRKLLTIIFAVATGDTRYRD